MCVLVWIQKEQWIIEVVQQVVEHKTEEDSDDSHGHAPVIHDEADSLWVATLLDIATGITF